MHSFLHYAGIAGIGIAVLVGLLVIAAIILWTVSTSNGQNPFE